MSLEHVPLFCCREYQEKLEIGNKLKINMMVNDKIQVLSLFPDKIKKLWFCTEHAKIDGVKKYQPDFLSSTTLVKNWAEINMIVQS